MKYLNLETGEIVEQLSNQRLRTHRIEAYVGIDTPFPDECKDAESLQKCLAQLDHYLKPYSPIVVNTEYLLDSVAGKHCTMKAAHSVKELSKYCAGWNIGYVSKADVLKACGIDASHFARTLKELKPLVRIDHIHLDVYKVVFHPFVVWKGDENNQQSRIKQWYKGV